MATTRPFAYNPSLTPIAGTEQVGTIAIGVSASSYSTAATGVNWWMGPDEDTGYVIAKPLTAGNQPFNPSIGVTGANVGFSRSASLTETSFVDLANNIAAGASSWGSTGGTAAKAWLNANGYWTSFGNNSIVTSGLTLRLDASDSASYPGSGTTWFDLANPQQNITLVNSPSYTSGSPSYFSFNGSNQYGSGSSAVLTSTTYTKQLWFYLNSYADNNLVSSSTGGHYMYFSGGNKLYSGHTNWAGFPTNYPSTASFNLNTWYNVALTFNTTDGMKLYINGSLDSTYTTIKTAFTGDGSTNLASYGGGNLLNGRIAKVYCYDTSITAADVLQNFNAEKSQFGL